MEERALDEEQPAEQTPWKGSLPLPSEPSPEPLQPSISNLPPESFPTMPEWPAFCASLEKNKLVWVQLAQAEPGAWSPSGAEILCPESAHAVLSVSKNLELLKQRLSELCGLAVPLTLRKAEAQTRHSLLEQNRQSRQQAAKDLRKEWEQDPLVLEIRKVFGGGKVRGVPKLDS